MGLVGVVGAPKFNIWEVGAEEGPDFTILELDFFRSTIKLPTMTYLMIGKCHKSRVSKFGQSYPTYMHKNTPPIVKYKNF